MISGVCFGRKFDLPELRFCEKMAITKSRLFSTTVQIVPKHETYTFLRGTCISFPHSGPAAFTGVLPLSVEDLSEQINVMFVGTQETWTKHQRDLLAKFFPGFSLSNQ